MVLIIHPIPKLNDAVRVLGLADLKEIPDQAKCLFSRAMLYELPVMYV